MVSYCASGYEILSVNIGKDIGNMVAPGSHRPDTLGPFAVLHATAMFLAGVFLRKLDGAIVAKPANMLEWTPGRFLHRLHPAMQRSEHPAAVIFRNAARLPNRSENET